MEAIQEMFLVIRLLIQRYTGFSATEKATVNIRTDKNGKKINTVRTIVNNNKINKKYFSDVIVCILVF